MKTLTDPGAGLVKQRPVPTKIASLLERPVPRTKRSRNTGVEMTVFRVRANLVSMKTEDDGDIHLVIAQPGSNRAVTMIAEFPAASCAAGAPAWARTGMASARKTLTSLRADRYLVHRRARSSDRDWRRVLRFHPRPKWSRAERGRASPGAQRERYHLLTRKPSTGSTASDNDTDSDCPDDHGADHNRASTSATASPRHDGRGQLCSELTRTCASRPRHLTSTARTFLIGDSASSTTSPIPDPHRFDGDHDGIGCES